MSGSIIACQINSVGYTVDGETDITEMPGHEVEGKPTSGDTNFKRTKKVAERQNIDLIVDAVEKGTLEGLKTVVPLSYTEADGTVNSGPGMINITSRSTNEEKMTVAFIPQKAKWNVFPPTS